MDRIRILLVESVPAEAQFFAEALDETQELRVQGDWTACELTVVENIEDTRDVVAAGGTDLIVFDPPSTSRILPSFSLLRESAPAIPIVVLLDRGNEPFAPGLLRAGAQDYLVKEELDCAPLARAIHNAIHRQRLLNAARQNAVFDELTGLYNECGLQAIGPHLVSADGQPRLLMLADIDDLDELTSAYGHEQRELAILAASDALRAAVGEQALLACLGGWAVRGNRVEPVRRTVHHPCAMPARERAAYIRAVFRMGGGDAR